MTFGLYDFSYMTFKKYDGVPLKNNI